MTTIAALIITYNEEENIEDCLESIKWVDEIVVIDSYSEDNTVEICRKYTEKVFPRKFDDFASQRNCGLEKIESDWVLVVDADERVTGELKDEIKNVLFSNDTVQAYKIPRKNYFLGKWIKHCGWYPDYTLRVFMNKKNQFEGMVHEKVTVNGEVQKMKNNLIHYTYYNISQFIQKTDKYTTLDAIDMYRKGRKFKLGSILINPIWRFIRMFIIKRGYKDGIRGFILSMLYLFYAFLKYIKLFEIWNNGE
ncbi:MAG: glycosyltransferase family 2 protein [Firmicutes bacterium]|nr:glycosyltransferase family 2 protein [Bacillota bacterium]